MKRLCIVVIFALTPPSATTTARAACDGVDVASALADTVDQYPAGTTFCLRAKTYAPQRVVDMEANDKLIGADVSVTRQADGDVASVRPASRVDLSQIPTGAKAGINWGGSTVLGTGVLDSVEVFGMKRNKDCASNGGCGAGVGGQQNFVVRNSYVHSNAWGAFVNSANWDMATTEIAANSTKADGMGFYGVGVGGMKILAKGTFVDMYVHDNGQAGLWSDIEGDSPNILTVRDSRLHHNYADVVYEISAGQLTVSGNDFEGGAKAVDIESSRDAVVYDNDFEGSYGADAVEIAYGSRALPEPDCSRFNSGKCNGFMPAQIVVHNNTGLSGTNGVTTTEWEKETNSTRSDIDCILENPDDVVIQTYECPHETRRHAAAAAPVAMTSVDASGMRYES